MRIHILQIAKSVLASVLVSLIFVLLFTVVIQLFSVPSAAIKPVNQVFKILSVVIGGLLFIRGDRGLIKGALHGAIAVTLTFLLFGAISMSLSWDWKFVLEIFTGAAAGAITGVIAVNLKSKT